MNRASTNDNPLTELMHKSRARESSPSRMADIDPRASYSVLDLYLVGSRMTDDFDESAAVEYYLELHPDADADKVRAELESELKRIG